MREISESGDPRHDWENVKTRLDEILQCQPKTEMGTTHTLTVPEQTTFYKATRVEVETMRRV